jgi:hypothetical protein
MATVVVASEEPMWYSGDTTNMAPQVEDAVQEYVDESHTKMIAVLPLKRPQLVEKEKERPDDPDDSPAPIGALIVEQIEDSRVPQRMLSRVDVVAKHSSAALANSLEHENVFLMPLWRTLGKSRWVVQGRNLPKVVLGAVAVVVLIVVMAVVPADFRLHAKGTLEPVLRHDVFAGIDGKVTEVDVEHGSPVKAGDRLALLRNYRLSEEIATLVGNIATTADQMDRIQRQLTMNRQVPQDEATRLHGELLEQKAKLDSLYSQRRIYMEQEKDLQVRSPADGVVITWDLHNRLIDRPVQRGQSLMRVADPQGPWQLELQMSEDRMGHIMRAQNETRAKVRERLREVLCEKMRDQVRQKLRIELAAQVDRPAPLSPGGATPGLEGTPPAAANPGLNKSDAAPPAPAGVQPSEPTPAGTKSSESSSTAARAAEDADSNSPKAEPAEKPSSMLSSQKLVGQADEPDGKASQAAPKSEPSPPAPSAPTRPAEDTKSGPEKPAGEAATQTSPAPAPQSPATPAEKAEPAPSPSEQTAPAESNAKPVQPAASPESELDKRVEEQLPVRLNQEVDAVLAGVREGQLAKKLREVSDEVMEDRLRVSYILATDPGSTHYGYVEDMQLAAEVRGEEGNTVLIKVAIKKDELQMEHVRPGASVTAKVECGRRSIGYVWFHDLIAFVRKAWFRWF